jgi:hypothetical protein
MRKCPPPPLGRILAESVIIASGWDPRWFVIRLGPNQCDTKALGNMIVIWRPLPVGVALPSVRVVATAGNGRCQGTRPRRLAVDAEP